MRTREIDVVRALHDGVDSLRLYSYPYIIENIFISTKLKKKKKKEKKIMDTSSSC